MSTNEEQEPGIVRADILQRFTARQRIQARLNIRAMKMPDPIQAYVYGLGLLAFFTSSPPAGALPDDGGVVVINKTPGGNWSSDGTDTAPVTGPWLFFKRVATTATVDGETEYGDENFPAITQTVVHWEIEYWEDGAQDTGFAWISETLHADLAEDLFIFRTWSPVPYSEDAQVTIWIQPIEPEPTGGGGGVAFTEILEADYLTLDPPADIYYDITDIFPT